MRLETAVCGWELSHHAADRVRLLAEMYETFSEVEIIGCHFPHWGREIWQPLRTLAVPCHSFVVENPSGFVLQALELVAAHPYDVVHLSEPRFTNILFGLLYKLLWGATVIMDIDREEPAFVRAQGALDLADQVGQHGKLPELEAMGGREWTYPAVGLAGAFDEMTLAGEPLQQCDGFEITGSDRDEQSFQPIPDASGESSNAAHEAFEAESSFSTNVSTLYDVVQSARKKARKVVRDKTQAPVPAILHPLIRNLEPLPQFLPLVGLPSRIASKARAATYNLKEQQAASVMVEDHRELLIECEDGSCGDGHLAWKPSRSGTLSSPGNVLQPVNGKSLSILFVLYNSIESNSGLHAQIHAARLEAQGMTCHFAVPFFDKGRQATCSGELLGREFSVITHHSLLHTSHALPPYDIIHAWTPRENVRKVCEKLLERHKFPLVIHLEDNEEYLTEAMVGYSFGELVGLPEAELDRLIPSYLYHPRKGRAFLDRADGLTLIIDTLERFNIRKVPTLVLPAPVDDKLFYPRPLNMALRRELNIPEDHVVLAYTGNMHEANWDEIHELYKAVRLLNEQDCPTVLLRTGQDCPSLPSRGGQCRREAGVEYTDMQHVRHLGLVDRVRLPDILAAADILVQPGAPGPFNDQRMPSKLPEYFAMGRPVILPRTNLGLRVKHGKEGYVLDRADGAGIAGAVNAIVRNEALRTKLSEGSIGFFLNNYRNFKESLSHFYKSVSYGGY